MTGRSVLILSTTDWDAPQFGSRQQIALEFARRGHHVLFVEVPRALHSFVSDPAGTRRALRRMGRIRQVEEGVLVYTPLPVLPIYYSPVTNGINQRLLQWYLRRVLARLSWRLDVLWTYWPNTSYLIGRLSERLAVYHCIDDFVAAGYPLTAPQTVARMEAKQCQKVDLVFARTVALAEAKRQFNANTHLLPGGVNVGQFDPERVDAVPDAVRAVSRPRIGFVGTIDDRVDVDLVAYCASHLSNAQFVFVGPVRRHRAEMDISVLETLLNVHLLPACPHSEVPAIVSGFDVCLIPYVVNSYTRGLSPIKLYEYLAMGKPVVATDLPYLRREQEHIQIAATKQEFLWALERVLADPPLPGLRARWRAVAAFQSWSKQLDVIEQHLSVLLEDRVSGEQGVAES